MVLAGQAVCGRSAQLAQEGNKPRRLQLGATRHDRLENDQEGCAAATPFRRFTQQLGCYRSKNPLRGTKEDSSGRGLPTIELRNFNRLFF